MPGLDDLTGEELAAYHLSWVLNYDGWLPISGIDLELLDEAFAEGAGHDAIVLYLHELMDEAEATA
jgi:hypothetical protein